MLSSPGRTSSALRNQGYDGHRKKNYAQIEKENLAICYACHKFHKYIFGKEVYVQTDHRPLGAVFKKSLGKASPRLQRMPLRLQRYQLKMQGDVRAWQVHVYGADTLSPAYQPGRPEHTEMEEEVEVMVHCLVRDLPLSAMRKDQIQAAAAEDPDLQKVRQAAMMGCPRKMHPAPGIIQDFWPVKDDVHVAEGMLFVGDRIVVPKSLKAENLALLLETHMGATKTKARAMNTLFRSGIDADIEEWLGVYTLPPLQEYTAKRASEAPPSGRVGMAESWRRHLHICRQRLPADHRLPQQIPRSH